MPQNNSLSHCMNCGKPLNGLYCYKCGQKNLRKRLILKDLFRDFMHHVLELETPFLFTLRNLMIRPGEVCRAYVEGKRKSYISPLQYFIISLAVYLFIFYWLDINVVGTSSKMWGIDNANPYQQDIERIITQNMNLLFFILIPILAFFSRLFFRKSGFNYTENLVLFFYVYAHLMFLTTLLMPIYLFDPDIFMNVSYLIDLIYMPWAMVQFHRSKVLPGVLKGIFVYLISSVILIGITIVAISVYMAFKYYM